jgi:hypothetical protein
MSKVLLPITSPTITTATGYADALAILQSYEKANDWVYSQYIQMFALQNMPRDPQKEYWPLFGHTESFFCDFDYRRIANTTNDGIFLDREKCPYLNVFEIPYELIEHFCSSFIELIKTCIDNSMYVYGIADVSGVTAYNGGTTHPMLIYGYDDDVGEFYFGDFLDGNNAYRFEKCSFIEAEVAFQNAKNTDFPLVKSIAAVRFVEDASFEFDWRYIRKSVRSYLYPDSNLASDFAQYATSYFSVLNWKANAFLGMEIYDFLHDFFEIEKQLNMYPTDIVPFHAFYDHKAMMAARLKYFCNTGYIKSDKHPDVKQFDSVVERALSIRNQVMKYNIQLDSSFPNSLYEQLTQLKDAEFQILKSIFEV